MRVFPVASVLLLSLSAFPFAAQAVSVSELPATIQSCISAGSCVVDYSGSYNSTTASAFVMVDLPSGKWNWLVRYDLASPSGQTDINGVQSSTYGGYLWMQVANNYSAAETAHPVTLFLDKVTPVPGSMFNQSGDLSLLMTTADLLAGGAYRTQADPGYGDFNAGNLSGEIPLICVAEGCQINAQINLVQLNYQSSGSSGIAMTGFNAADTRGLVYTQREAYFNPYVNDNSFNNTQTFYISSVPEPDVTWLLGIGLMSVVVAVRRRKARR